MARFVSASNTGIGFTGTVPSETFEVSDGVACPNALPCDPVPRGTCLGHITMDTGEGSRSAVSITLACAGGTTSSPWSFEVHARTDNLDAGVRRLPLGDAMLEPNGVCVVDGASIVVSMSDVVGGASSDRPGVTSDFHRTVTLAVDANGDSVPIPSKDPTPTCPQVFVSAHVTFDISSADLHGGEEICEVPC